MEEGFGEECGVVGMYMKKLTDIDEVSLLKTPSLTIRGLSALQHRGQRSAGIESFNPLLPYETKRRKVMTGHKDVGLVEEVFKLKNARENELILRRCMGRATIGHVRYSTSGRNRDDYFAALDEAQPFERKHQRDWKRFAIGFNGNIVNSGDLRNELEQRGYVFETEVDTEVLMAMLARRINRHSEKEVLDTQPCSFDVFKDFMSELDGCFNITSLFGNGDMVVARDPWGFRPLACGENDEYYGVASESSALEKMGLENIREIEPGEVIKINSHGVQSKKVLDSLRRAFCQFEYVYFAKANSVINGRCVREVRQNLGRELAAIEPLKGKFDDSFIVVPAPRTAIAAAEAYSQALRLRFVEAIEKDDRYRGFINGEEERKRIMESTYTVHRDVKGKKVLIVEDSLVRGETIKILNRALRKAGASEVHGRFTEPLIMHPCHYGVDYPSSDELLAARYSGNGANEEECSDRIARYIGLDGAIFQTLDGLVRAIGMPVGSLCLACLNGDYPTPCGKRIHEASRK